MDNFYIQSQDSFSTSNILWILISAALVFFMQAGFKVLETGLVKEEHRSGIGIKNLMDWVAGSLAFFIIGFGIMFGESAGGFFGASFFAGFGLDEGYPLVFFIFQLAFAGTALTIVSGAMSGRTALGPYFIASLFTAVIVYPVFGHWAWGNLLIETNEPWLAKLGFMDFAGSTVVHSVGAWVGIVGIWMVGPRLGRFTAKGVIQPVKASDYAYSVLGLMILWLGWWGFNGGSVLAFDQSVPLIILNTNLAAAGACFSAYLHAKFVQKNKDLIEKVIGGSLTGLVAITACCNVVSPISSIVIGLLAGVLHNYSYILISEKWKLDDPVGAIPVHGFGGIFGTLCVALFGNEEMLVHSRWVQLGVQTLGIFVCMVFTVGISYFIFVLVKSTIGLRLSPEAEKSGAVFETATAENEGDNSPEEEVSQVSVRVGDRSYNLFKVEEYLNLPRETRLDLIKKDSVQYLDDNGNVLPTASAIRYLAGVIEQQRDEVNAQNSLIELSILQENMEVIGNLQDVLLGEEHNIVSVFPDSFVMMRAKESVARDFYWHGKEKGYNIIIAASALDPTISSAFVSAMAISQLNEIVGMKKILPPEKILALLDAKFHLALKHSKATDHGKIGVEMGVLLVDTNRRKAYYTGSGQGVKLFVKKLDENLEEYKNIDIPLGDPSIPVKEFERVKIDFNKGDSFYLATSGLANQLNPNGKRFANTKLRVLLEKNGGKSMLEQKLTYENALEDWKGEESQSEDVLLIGIKP